MWRIISHLRNRQNSNMHYYEDFVRVYPDGYCLNQDGKQIIATQGDINNFLNHRKFYLFAAQFARGIPTVDVGCGSGYGCALLKEKGAALVCGSDASQHAIDYAKTHFGKKAEFSVQDMTKLNYSNHQFGLTVCSEVLEHIKEYHLEDTALEEMKRITKVGGVIVIGTPNSEMLGSHGFWFNEINSLMERHFANYCIFENALIPTWDVGLKSWNDRIASGHIGVVVSENIDIKETVGGRATTILKKGIPSGVYNWPLLSIDTTLLHNTHSWIIVALCN
jgi:2-polyprenyl-3-methyl-5-hydroxy-6-metoxy-1,4-benzoquinol methylase